MGQAPFRFSTPQPVTTEVSLEPVYNALTSLSLLNAVNYVPDPDPWITQTAAQLTSEQRHRNRLVFEGLGEALTTDQSWADFPAYLDHLKAVPPATFRDHLLRRLCRAVPSANGASSGVPTPVRLLSDKQVFLRQLERLYPADPVDDVLQTEVHTLLNDPCGLHDLVVTHLRSMWWGYLADEWQRRLPFLRSVVHMLRDREWPNTTVTEAIRAFIGRDLPPTISAQLDGVQRIVFSVSPHVGPYASRFGSDTTIWVFARGRAHPDQPHQRPTLDLPLRQSPVKRVELVGPFSALADETRLRILELLAQGELLAQDIIMQLGLSQSSVSRHLKQLTSAGFLQERRGEGANKRYRLNEAKVDWAFLALKQLLTQPMRAADQPAHPFAMELQRFLNTDGRITTWPARRKDQVTVLRYLADQFQPGQEYTEKQVNEVLSQRIGKPNVSAPWEHTVDFAVDHATLRRKLMEERLMQRTSDGARYWRVDDQTT